MTAPANLAPGDILERETAGETAAVILQRVDVYPTGDAAIVYRYANSPRGISWSGFVGRGEDVRVIGHDAAADLTPRSLLSGDPL